uniref:GH16 domain-containing protein n=1 Tax=Lotharella globosa TaxID=91324 RepID=A0A7S3YVI9_9EUKA
MLQDHSCKIKTEDGQGTSFEDNTSSQSKSEAVILFSRFPWVYLAGFLCLAITTSMGFWLMSITRADIPRPLSSSSPPPPSISSETSTVHRASSAIRLEGANIKNDTNGTSYLNTEDTTITQYAGYKLDWHDEFNIDGRPDNRIWGYEKGFVRNQELQFYTESAARVENGSLVITASRWRDESGNYKYQSASLKTAGKRTLRYGRVEVRARLKTLNGLWPAIWLVGGRGRWPSCGEIDMMEYYRHKIHANVATGTARQKKAKWDSASIRVGMLQRLTGLLDFDEDWHVWRMDWDSQWICLYVDGHVLNKIRVEAMENPVVGMP